MTARASLCENIMKSVTIRKLAVLVVVMFVIKLAWRVLLGQSPPDLELGEMERVPDFGYKSPACNFVNGECKGGKEAEVPITGKGLYTYKDKFYLDGQPFRIIGGSFHYFRTHPDQWMDRLLKMKAAGLNTVTTYIAWNVHEKVRLQYNFVGRHDLAAFIRQVQSVGLHMIVRAGPYICAEWDLGGLPAWLLHEPDIVLRSSASDVYMRHVEQYFSKLLPILYPFTHKQGGPIIAFQIENEFGSYKSRDDAYMTFLIEQHKRYRLDELYFTSDGGSFLKYGPMPGVLATVNFAKRPEKILQALQDFQPNKPLMVTEFWSGWFDHWTEGHHSFGAEETALKVYTILGKFNASINFYMFTGGTNFAFYNGANNDTMYQPTVTSYDYDAPIAETGDVTPKYRAIRDVIKQLHLGPIEWPEIPPNSEKTNYGRLDLTQMLDYSDLVKISQQIYGKIVQEKPAFMELLSFRNGKGQNYGWILYRATFPKGSNLVIKGDIRDRAQILINGREMAVYDWHSRSSSIPIKQSLLLENNNVLDLLVENMGRVNYRRANDDPRLLENQKKGLNGEIYIDDAPVTHWELVPFEFDYQFHEAMIGSSLWRGVNIETGSAPKVLRGRLNVLDAPTDSFLDMSTWNKGVVFINGFNIGRYWNVGPTKTLYVPAPLLRQGQNDVIVFDLNPVQTSLQFSDHALLG